MRRCLHCGLPIAGDRTGDFCCRGCEAAATLLHRLGLDAYYELRPGTGVPVDAPPETSEPWTLEPVPESGLELDVFGIACAACVWTLERLFEHHGRGTAGAIEIDPTLGLVSLRTSEGFDLPAFTSDAASLGYTLKPRGSSAKRSESTGWLVRTALCLLLAGNTMLFASAGYFGLSEGPFFDLLSRLSIGAATLAMLVGGGPLLRAAWRALRRGVVHLDLPIAVGVVLGYASVLGHFVQTGRADHADVLTAFIALMLVGRTVRLRSVEKVSRQLAGDPALEALETRVLRNGHPQLVSVGAVKLGDALLLGRDELLPVAATLETCAARFGLEWIDGESEARIFEVGQVVPAGAFHRGDARIQLIATETFAQSRLVRLLSARAAPSESSDGYAVAYVLCVLLAALAAALTAADPISVVFAVLVVTCPCALGVALPLARTLAHARLRRAGLFVRSPDLLDRLRHTRHVVFDKTGTLTTGVLEEAGQAFESLTPAQRTALATLVSGTTHPKASALAEALARFDDTARACPDTRVDERVGEGVSMTFEGHRFGLGTPGPPGEADLVFRVDGAAVASFRLREELRPDARHDLETLRARGLRQTVLSGDRSTRVHAVARRLGLPLEEAIGDATPDGKAAFVATLGGGVLYVGDGLNDAPAMAAVGTAGGSVGCPAVHRPLVAARCDFWLTTPGLAPIVTGLEEANRLHHTVRALQTFAVLYNLTALGFAFAGALPPVAIAIAMPLGSLLALGFVLARHRPIGKPDRTSRRARGFSIDALEVAA